MLLRTMFEEEASKRAALDLVDWYDHVISDSTFAQGPPEEGLDVLVDTLASASLPYDAMVRLSRARWAVRVAEELVVARSSLMDEANDWHFHAKLEGVLLEAHENLDGRAHDSQRIRA